MKKLIIAALLTFGLKRIGLLIVKLFESPAVKNAVSDAIFTATDRFLYDDRQGTQSRLRSRTRARARGSVTDLPRRTPSAPSRDFDPAGSEPFDHQKHGL